MISIVQAIDYLEFKNRLSKTSLIVYKEIRKIVPKFESDHIKYKEIAGVKDYLLERRLDLL
jgi:histidine ammonia-lyase